LKDPEQKELMFEKPFSGEANDLTGPKSKPKFEVSLKRLEEIVEELERGDLDLDRSLKLFEEGISMSRICTKRLNEMEKKIEILTKEGDDKLKKEPFPSPCSCEDGTSKETG